MRTAHGRRPGCGAGRASCGGAGTRREAPGQAETPRHLRDPPDLPGHEHPGPGGPRDAVRREPAEAAWLAPRTGAGPAEGRHRRGHPGESEVRHSGGGTRRGRALHLPLVGPRLQQGGCQHRCGKWDGISVKALSEQEGRISNKKPHKAGNSGSLLYGRFVKSATLTACGEESVTLPTRSESSEEEEEKLDLSSVRRLTDEELVQACGGRTAHKGARHGLTMSAKLARLEEQEHAFLARYRQQEQQQEPPESSQGKKKKRKQCRDGASPEVAQSQEPNREQEKVLEEEKVVKRKKKNHRPSIEEELTREEEVMRKKKVVVIEPCREDVSGEEGKVMKRRKKKPELSTEEEVVEEEEKAAKKRKKKKKKKLEEDKETAETDIPLQDTDEPNLVQSPTKKRKKKRRKREPE
ncbi:G patch domain-containing protein 4 isoform 1-T1 [Sylvia borin]